MLLQLDQQQLAALLPGTGERGFCAVADTRVIGSAILAERGGTAYLWGMYVRPIHQRLGIGSRLLSAAIGSIAVSRRLEVRVMASSPAAVAFYRRHGLRPVGEELTEVMSTCSAQTLILAASVADLL